MAKPIIADSSNAIPADAPTLDTEGSIRAAFSARFTLDGVLSLLSDNDIDRHMATEGDVYSRFQAILAAFAATLKELDSDLWELSHAEAARQSEARS